MPTEMLERILTEACAMGFRGRLCLSHYNEPLMDDRIPAFGRFARQLGCFSEIFFATNADFMKPDIAAELDGTFDRLLVAIYLEEPRRSEREQWLQSMFTRTRLDFTHGVHIPTHYSPDFDVKSLAAAHIDRPCLQPLYRMILNHRGDMLFCCDDLIGTFNLGSVRTQSLQQLWYAPEHQRMIKRLLRQGGRRHHPHCATCPRP